MTRIVYSLKSDLDPFTWSAFEYLLGSLVVRSLNGCCIILTLIYNQSICTNLILHKGLNKFWMSNLIVSSWNPIKRTTTFWYSHWHTKVNRSFIPSLLNLSIIALLVITCKMGGWLNAFVNKLLSCYELACFHPFQFK